MRVDIHDGPEHMLQSEAGYIDARPLTPARQNLLQRTAGPYIWVKLRRTECEQMSSGLPLKADIAQYSRHVSKVPGTDSYIAANGELFDRLVGGREELRRNFETEGFRSFEVDDQLELCGLLDGKVCGARSIENATHIVASTPE